MTAQTPEKVEEKKIETKTPDAKVEMKEEKKVEDTVDFE